MIRLEEVDGNESETERDMSIKIRNTKMKMETFFMYSMKKVMMNTFKLLYDDKRCNFSFIRRERTCFVYKN